MAERSDTYSQFIRRYRIEHFKQSEDRRLFQEALALRIRVIVQEEGFPLDDEPDAQDEQALQWVVRDAKTYELIACARLRNVALHREKEKTVPVIEHPPVEVIVLDKLAVAPEHRGMGTGRFLMVGLLTYMRENQNVPHRVLIVAHRESIPFFESFGFHPLKLPPDGIYMPTAAVMLEREWQPNTLHEGGRPGFRHPV
jgi:predicted GNAT family N-acyltransferase